MDIKVVGWRIKQIREALHITQEELANSVGCTPQHIGAIERGIKTPRLDTLVTIANTLGASADLLLQDVLDTPVDSLATEISAAVAPLSPTLQRRVLNALRAFSEGAE
jgi:transcriptional regulator with XRE-family HTH domain